MLVMLNETFSLILKHCGTLELSAKGYPLSIYLIFSRENPALEMPPMGL